MKRVWDVEIGICHSRYTVIAKNYIEAGRKAMKLAEPVSPREEKYVSLVELIRQIRD